MLIHSSIFLFVDSTGAALHDPQMEIICIYCTLGFGAALQLIHSLKQAVLAAFPSRHFSSD